METVYHSHHPPPGDNADEPEWNVAHLFPPRGQWTEADYLLLPDDSRAELSEGCLELLPMPTEQHQLILGFLYRLLFAYVEAEAAGLVLMAGIPVRLWEGKLRQPDLVFLRAENSGKRGERFWEGADLAMEIVSPRGRDRDIVTKREEYARGGIAEYWIVDPERKQITVLALNPDATAYEVAGEYAAGDRAVSQLLPGFGVDVDAVLAVG